MRERGITLDPRWSKLAASNNYTKGETAEENEDECCRSSAVPVSHSNLLSDLSIRKWNFEARESKRREKIGRRIERERKSSSQNFSFLSPLKNKQTDNCWKSSPSNFYPTARITFYVLEQSEKENVARGELFSSLFSRLRSSLRSLITTFLWQCRGTILPSLPSSLLHLFSRAADTLNVDIHWRNVYVTSRTNKRANKRNEFEIEFTEFQILLR